jgi:NitT/TauT family transport system substrate-binding protein
VRVIIQPYLSYAPLLIARAEGYFAREGLDVEFLSLGRNEGTMAAVLSGQVDVWPGIFGPALLSAMARGGRIRIVADRGHLASEGCTYVGVVLRKGLTPGQASARIKRVSGGSDGSSAYVFSRMLGSKGIKYDSLEFVHIPPQVLAQAIAEGSVDAVGATEPWLTQVARQGTQWLSAQEVLPDYQWGVMTFGPRLLGQDRGVGVRFMVAFRRGVEQYNQGKTPRNLEVLARETGQTQDELRTACWPSIRADGRINLASILEYQEWGRQRGVIDTPATPAMIWDSSFVTAADSAAATHRQL